jgi:hypothetical protein
VNGGSRGLRGINEGCGNVLNIAYLFFNAEIPWLAGCQKFPYLYTSGICIPKGSLYLYPVCAAVRSLPTDFNLRKRIRGLSEHDT